MPRSLVATLLMLSAIIAAVCAGSPPTVAQDTLYAELQLEEYAEGAYRVDVSLQGDIDEYSVQAHVSRVGSDQGVVSTLSEGNDPETSINLQLPLDGMSRTEPACYHVQFFVDDADDIAVEQALTTYACVDEAGATTFPAYDSEQSPLPAPPSDVRLVSTGDNTWEIVWRNNSTDVIANDPGILLFDRPWTFDSGAVGLGGIELPPVPGDWTRAGSINFFFTPTLYETPVSTEPVCGYALVLVFAIGLEGQASLPGNTTLPACFTARGITFPETGVGSGTAGAQLAWVIATAMVGVGAALLAPGARSGTSPCVRLDAERCPSPSSWRGNDRSDEWEDQVASKSVRA